jgi:hypothetical protein
MANVLYYKLCSGAPIAIANLNVAAAFRFLNMFVRCSFRSAALAALVVGRRRAVARVYRHKHSSQTWHRFLRLIARCGNRRQTLVWLPAVQRRVAAASDGCTGRALWPVVGSCMYDHFK